jgi:predicted O-linked N-acetylglucosamine transferase (SPINDLY family)
MSLNGRKIIQWSPPRSGSTLVWQILDKLFEDPTYTENKWLKPNIVQKTHTLDYSKLDNPNYFFITTIRNPIDCMVSFMTVNREEFTKENIETNMKLYLNYFDVLKLVKKSKYSVILRYEQFYDDFTVIYDTIEKVFGIKITTAQREEMNSTFSRTQNKKIANTMKNFDSWEKNSFIHGDHINSSKISYWKDKIPLQFQAGLEKAFAVALNTFQYKQDWGHFYKTGIDFYKKKEFPQAILLLEKSIALYEHHDTMKDLGTIHREYGETMTDETAKTDHIRKAIHYYKQILESGETIDVSAKYGILSALCNIYFQYKNNPMCATYLEQIGLISNDSMHFSKAGYYYLTTKQIEKSLECYNKSIYLDPHNYFAYNNIAQIYCHMGAHHLIYQARKQAISKVQQIISGDVHSNETTNKIQNEYPIIFSNMLLDLNYISDCLSPQEIFEKHCEYGTIFEAPLYEYHTRKFEYKNDKIRIGYLGNDFRNHAVGSLFHSFFANFNQEKFEVYVYSNTECGDETQTIFKACPVVWNDISKMEDLEVVELVQSHQINILVEVTSHTGVNRLKLCCHRLAPVQVSYLAYPNTTGLQTMDYKFTDQYLVADDVQQFYTETLYPLKHGIHSYTPNPEYFEIQRKPSDRIRFGCFNNPSKLGERCVKAFSDILKLVPNSILVIRYNYCDNNLVRGAIENKFKYHGITRDRLDITFSKTKKEYIQAYNQIDVVLDPFPYNGHSVFCEALWMSVPPVTLKGTMYHERVGYSMLSHLGLDELVAETVDDYVDKVCDLATDKKRRVMYNLTIHDKIKNHPMSDSTQFVNEFERAYEDIWRIYQE